MDAFQDKWPRWRQLTSTAAHRGVLCFGPNRSRHVTYTNPHRWLPGFHPQAADVALRTLVTSYLYAYGPATPQHLARWLNIPPRRAIDLFDTLAGELEPVEMEGGPAWVVAGDTETPQEPASRDPPPSLLRCLRRRRSASRDAVPGRGRGPCPLPNRSGRELPGCARQWRGRRGLAPTPVGSKT